MEGKGEKVKICFSAAKRGGDSPLMEKIEGPIVALGGQKTRRAAELHAKLRKKEEGANNIQGGNLGKV